MTRIIMLERLHQPGRIALLKSPNHALRIDVLAAAYGEARFIAIARDPRDLLASNERMWLELFALYALGKWSRDWVRQFFVASYRLFLEQIRWAQATLPPERFACVTFDKLTAEPDAVLRRLHAQLRLPDCEAASLRIASLLATRAGHRTKGRQPGSEDGEFLEQALGVSLLREGCRLAGTQYP